MRPPGHHAGPAFFGGSCYFNNAAAAAQRLRAAGFDRVAIVDIDAHQGNGTQEIFWDRGDVLYASVHVDPGRRLVPAPRRLRRRARRREPARGGTTTRRCPPAAATSRGWRRSTRCCAASSRTGSEALVVSLGVDAAVDDPAAPLMITPDGFRAAGARLAALGLPTVFVQEGGYDLARLAPLVPRRPDVLRIRGCSTPR